MSKSDEMKKDPRYKEVTDIEAQIEALTAKRDAIYDSIEGKTLNDMAKSIMDKWIKIPGWSICNEDSDKDGYRLGKVDKILHWEGNSSFRVHMSHLIFVDADGNHKDRCVMLGAKDAEEQRIEDIDNCTVLSEKKVAELLEKLFKRVSNRFTAAINSLGNHYVQCNLDFYKPV